MQHFLLSDQLAEQLLVVVRVGDPREHVAVAAERHAEATQRLASQIAPRLRQVDMHMMHNMMQMQQQMMAMMPMVGGGFLEVCKC